MAGLWVKFEWVCLWCGKKAKVEHRTDKIPPAPMCWTKVEHTTGLCSYFHCVPHYEKAVRIGETCKQKVIVGLAEKFQAEKTNGT